MARGRKTTALTLVPEAALDGEVIGSEGVEAGASDGQALALTHSAAAIGVLAHLMNHATSEASRIAAANAMLDRAYGKARVASPPSPGPRQVRLTVVFV